MTVNCILKKNITELEESVIHVILTGQNHNLDKILDCIHVIHQAMTDFPIRVRMALTSSSL